MKSKMKMVFYCDFCTKHGLSRAAMEKHERHCTMNQDRVCRWHLLDYMPSWRALDYGGSTHHMRRGLPRWVRMFAPLDEERSKRFREHALGCPACMLTAIRLSGIDFFDRGSWHYEDEVKRYREDERIHWQEEERREIEATFL